ncbi:MAG: ABC transporter ATP-binding protein [Actinobacteria bacterium]|nr:ABC transporter ATP-binding protein [Actinomycetota bacterium]
MNNGTLIRFTGVTKVYPMGEGEVRALSGVDLEIPRGELVVVLGPSGSGKTTFLNLIGGMDTVTSGSLIVNGSDISCWNYRQLTEYRRTQIGFIFQFFNLMDTLTALENVQLSLELVRKNGNGAARKALEAVGLGERVCHFPNQLSGGEQQRVAIARAICKGPPILLCDEPTGELDFRTGIQILQLMQDLNRDEGHTVIIVTHNSAIAEMANRVVHLHDGRVATVDLIEQPARADSLKW